jgi:XisH protein
MRVVYHSDFMPAKDKFHDVVEIALRKDGWQITDTPLSISVGGVDMLIDLGAERLIAAEKQGEKIAVEIKSFLNSSAITDFHLAVGQFINYRTALKLKEPDRQLFLAVPLTAYNDFFKREFAKIIMEDYQLKLLVYDVEEEVIALWKR